LKPHGLITYPEFGGFLANCEKQYMQGTKETLTELYDTPPSFSRELRSGSIYVERPCISILGASTLEWFERQLTEADKWSGFLQRFLFSTIETRTKVSLPVCPPLDPILQNSVVKRMADISSLSGARVLSPEATVMYNEWLDDNGIMLDRAPNEQLIGSYVQRIEINALKIASLIEASWGDLTEISPGAMYHAIGISEYYKRNAFYLLNEGLSFSRVDKLKKRILDFLRKNGGRAPRRTVNQNLRQVNSTRERDDLIRMLFDEGRIVEVDEVKYNGQTVRMLKIAEDENTP
jgi:hypothetical protein